MDLGLLDLMSVAYFSGVKSPLCMNVKLKDLTICELQKVDVVSHPDHIDDSMLRDLDDLLAIWIRSVVDPEHSSL